MVMQENILRQHIEVFLGIKTECNFLEVIKMQCVCSPSIQSNINLRDTDTRDLNEDENTWAHVTQDSGGDGKVRKKVTEFCSACREKIYTSGDLSDKKV